MAGALLLMACPPSPASRPVGAAETVVLEPDEVERDIVEGVNVLRREGGSAPLVQHPALTQIARAHVEAMAAGRVPFGHTGHEKRLAAAANAVGGRWGAENLAFQRLPSRDIPEAVVSRWLANDKHRQSLLGLYQYVGVAAVRTADGGWYVVWIVAGS